MNKAPLESQVVKQISAYLKSLPECWFMKTHGGRFGKKGIPDIVGCHKGRMFAIEVKRPGGKATALQLHELKKIKAAGGIALVAESKDEVAEALSEKKSIVGDKALEAIRGSFVTAEEAAFYLWETTNEIRHSNSQRTATGDAQSKQHG